MQLPPESGRRSPQWERLAVEITAGRIPWEAVAAALEFWRLRLSPGLWLPNREYVTIPEDSLYHMLLDHRLWRMPRRIESILLGILTIRTGFYGRRRALSQWQEGEVSLSGYAIIDQEGVVRTAHLVRPAEFRRQLNLGEHLWP